MEKEEIKNEVHVKIKKILETDNSILVDDKINVLNNKNLINLLKYLIITLGHPGPDKFYRTWNTTYEIVRGKEIEDLYCKTCIKCHECKINYL